ncbi:MAG: hypothetical protein Q8Q49_02120 [bacterium]|nr:hypothetical protein [bacterium]
MEKSRYMPQRTRFEKDRMISEGGPVIFDPEQVESREPLPAYETRFSTTKALERFVEFFATIPFDEGALEESLQEYLGKRDVDRSRSHLRSMLGELFLEKAIDTALHEIHGIQQFPGVYVASNFEIRARDFGFNLFRYYNNEGGEQRRKNVNQFDGLIQVETEQGRLLTVVLESKISGSNLGRTALNSAIRPSGAKEYTEDMIKIFGTVGYCVAAPSDRISDSIPLQQKFKANGGFLLPFPFTYQQADEIAQRVAGSENRSPA